MTLPATCAARFPRSSPMTSPRGRSMLIACRFTTGADSGGSPALEYDYDGRIQLALTEGSPDLYVLNVGIYKRLLSAVVSHNLAASVNITVTGSASAGTITLSNTANALASATVDVIVAVQIAEN